MDLTDLRVFLTLAEKLHVGRTAERLSLTPSRVSQLLRAPDDVGVVSALHTVSGAMLANLQHPVDEDVLVCGDSREDKRKVIELIERIDGLRAVDCGRLEQARIVESMTALLIGINIRHKTHAGIRITGLPDRTPARVPPAVGAVS